MTPAQRQIAAARKAAKAAGPKKPSKYKNKPTVVDGIRFASKKEANRYGELKQLERAGKIVNLQCHPAFEFMAHGVWVGKYTADFSYSILNGQPIVEDVKSPATRKGEAYGLRKRLMKAIHGIDVVET